MGHFKFARLVASYIQIQCEFLGGEGREPVSPNLIRRFNQYFPEQNLTPIKLSTKKKNLEFLNMNILAMKVDKSDSNELSVIEDTNSDSIKIILSHMPLHYAKR